MSKPEIDLREMRHMDDSEVREYLIAWGVHGLQNEAGHIPAQATTTVDEDIDTTLDRLPDPDEYLLRFAIKSETQNDLRIFKAIKYLKARAFEHALPHLKNLWKHKNKFFAHIK